MCSPLSERADIDCLLAMNTWARWIARMTENPGLVCVGRVPNSQNAIPVAGGAPDLKRTVYVQERRTSLFDGDVLQPWGTLLEPSLANGRDR